jgi:hypothetical protein
LEKPVLYYGRPYDRAYFENKGWRGRWILLLHWLWAKLGRKIEYHVMILVSKRHGFDKPVIRALKHRFYAEDQEGASPRRSALAAFGVDDVRFRYEEGRKNGPVISDRVQRQKQQEFNKTQESLARLMARKRSRPYAAGRDTFSVQEVDVEPIDESHLLGYQPETQISEK